jgi:hypothetical protein
MESGTIVAAGWWLLETKVIAHKAQPSGLGNGLACPVEQLYREHMRHDQATKQNEHCGVFERIWRALNAVPQVGA